MPSTLSDAYLQQTTVEPVVNEVALVVKGATGQTANLQEWRNSVGTPLVKIRSGGGLTYPNATPVDAWTLTPGGTNSDSLYFYNLVGGTTPVFIITGALYGNPTGGDFGVHARRGLYITNEFGATGTPLIVRGAVAQTGALQEWQDSAATVKTRITAAGRLGVNAQASSAMIATVIDADSAIGFLVQGRAAQTGDLQQWTNSAGTTLARVAFNGTVEAITNKLIARAGAQTFDLMAGASDHVYMGFFARTADLATRSGYFGYPSTASTTLALVNQLTGGTLQLQAADGIDIFTTNSGAVPLDVRGVASQTGDLQRWLDSASSTLARVTPTGGFVAQGFSGLNSGWDSYLGGGSAVAGTTFTINTGGAARIGLVVKGTASQTSNLQEWQNSAGTVLARFAADGQFFVIPKTTLSNVDFSNPGIGVESRFEFLKTNDYAWMSVMEHVSDNTTWTIGMGDNPDGGDVMRWYMQDYQGGGGDWEPLRIVGRVMEYRARDHRIYGLTNIQGPFFTGGMISGRFGHQNSGTPGQVWTNEQGTLVLTPSVTGYTSGGATVYWAKIDGVGTPNTFSWGVGSTGSAPVATLVPITGTAQTLSNGLTITFNATTGGVLNDLWVFTAYPGGKLAVGGTGAYANAALTVYTQQATSPGIIIRSVTGQSGNLQEWYNSSGALQTLINANCSMLLRTTTNYGAGGTAALSVGAPSAASECIVARGFASQTANLQMWQNSAGTILSKINAAGGIVSSYNGSADGMRIQGGILTGFASDGTSVRILLDPNDGATYRLLLQNQADATIGLIIKGTAAQTGDLNQWQNSVGTILSKVTAAGEPEIVTAGAGMILKSPNGTRYRVTVQDDGALVTAAA